MLVRVEAADDAAARERPAMEVRDQPVAARSSVDLPDPVPPATTTNSPASIDSETSRSAGTAASVYV